VRSKCRCSNCTAIRINSRNWQRSSSTREPSDPPLVVVHLFLTTFRRIYTALHYSKFSRRVCAGIKPAHNKIKCPKQTADKNKFTDRARATFIPGKEKPILPLHPIGCGRTQAIQNKILESIHTLFNACKIATWARLLGDRWSPHFTAKPAPATFLPKPPSNPHQPVDRLSAIPSRIRGHPFRRAANISSRP
jgi:hypothetical protein